MVFNCEPLLKYTPRRFDPGILYYMPQTWASDNTDAISRLKIQYGTSIVYSVSTIGAHVSDVPNHMLGG